MTKGKKVQLNLYIPEHYRNVLRRLAAARMYEDPHKSVTASGIATEILTECLISLEAREAELNEKNIQQSKESTMH